MIYEFLAHHQIDFERYDHPAVFTCDEARKYVRINSGSDTKNLFLRDKKGKRHFLVVVGYDKEVDLAELSATLNVPRLGLASAERLSEHLRIEPGAVSLLALINDHSHSVEVVVDEAIWLADAVRCHPLVNTSTLVISQEALQRFLRATAHEPVILNVPASPRP